MSEHEYKILTHIQTNYPVHWSEVLNAFDPQTCIMKTNAVLHSLLLEGMIQKTCVSDHPPHCWLRITGRGISALSEELSLRQENVRREEANKQNRLRPIASDKSKEKAKKNTDRIFQIFLTLLPLLISYLTTNLAAIQSFLIELLRAIFH